MLAKFAKIQADEFIETANAYIHDLRFSLGDRNEVLQDGLDHEVSKLIVDKNLNAFERYLDQVFFPMTVRSSDTVFDNLAAMFVTSHLSKVLND